MSDAVLTFLKFCLLAVLYLFLGRVVWIVARELRGTPAPQPAPVPERVASEPAPAGGRSRKAKPWRLVLLEPHKKRLDLLTYHCTPCDQTEVFLMRVAN